jgi:hypothetical protein
MFKHTSLTVLLIRIFSHIKLLFTKRKNPYEQDRVFNSLCVSNITHIMCKLVCCGLGDLLYFSINKSQAVKQIAKGGEKKEIHLVHAIPINSFYG